MIPFSNYLIQEKIYIYSVFKYVSSDSKIRYDYFFSKTIVATAVTSQTS